VIFRVSGPGRFGWQTLNCEPSNSDTAVTQTTASGFFQCNVAGADVVSARLDACTDCTVTVIARRSTAIFGGGGSGSGGVSITTGTEVPLTCTPGTGPNALFLDTDGTVNERLYVCISTDTLEPVLDSEVQGLTAVLTIDRIDGDADSEGDALTVGASATNRFWVIYDDPTDGLILTCKVSGVLHDCNKGIKLLNGKFWQVTNQAGTVVWEIDHTGALTEGSIDSETAGVTLKFKRYKWIPAGGCNNVTASSAWDLPASNPAVAACRTGTNTTKGVLNFADGSSLTAQWTEFLIEDWTGAIDATIVWQSGSTSTNNVVWQLAIACAGASDSDDPAFTDDVFTADANDATANDYNLTASNTITTTGTCAANDVMHIRLKRDAAHASDTLAATAQFVGLSLKLRDSQ
jgi:hypothetical protein